MADVLMEREAYYRRAAVRGCALMTCADGLRGSFGGIVVLLYG